MKRKRSIIESKKKNTRENEYKDFITMSNEDNIYIMDDDCKSFLCNKIANISEDDPALAILWDDTAIIDIINSIRNNAITNLPPRPNYVRINSIVDFKIGIIEHLRLVGGGSMHNIVAPNTSEQYQNVMIRLRDVEINPYVQALRIHIGRPFASTAKFMDRQTLSQPVPTNKIAPEPPNLLVFS